MPLFKQVGMQMVLFGAKGLKLYQLLFMQEKRDAVSEMEFGFGSSLAGICGAVG